MTDSSTGGFLAPLAPAPDSDIALDSDLCATVVGITGLDANLVRPRWQPKPPTQPPHDVDWCSVGVYESTPVGNPSLIFGGDDVGLISERETEIVALASFFGPNAGGYVAILRDGLGISQNREALRALGLGYVRINPPVRAPQLNNQEYVNRVDVQVVLRRMDTRIYPVKSLRTVPTTLRTQNGSADGYGTEINSFTVGP